MSFEDYTMSRMDDNIHNKILNSSLQQVRFLLNVMSVLRGKADKQKNEQPTYIITKADRTKTAQTNLTLAFTRFGVSYFCNINQNN